MTEVVRRTIRTSAVAGYRVFSTADPVHAHDYICDAYANTTMRLIGDQTSLRMRDEQHDLGWLTMSDFSHTAGLEQLVEPLDRLMVARVVAGRWRRDTIGEAQQTEQETCASWRNPTGPADPLGQPGPHAVRLDRPVRPAGRRAAPGDLVPRFTTLTPPSAGSKQLVAKVMDHLVRDVVANPTARTSPSRPARCRPDPRRRTAGGLSQQRHAGPDRSRPDRWSAVPVLRVGGYVHDHAHEDITVLATWPPRVGRQAVHLAFRQHLQSTPSCYLERVRLDRVHRDLTDLDPQSTTVEQVALLWGFTRLERFRRYYGHTYGTSPEQTLHG